MLSWRTMRKFNRAIKKTTKKANKREKKEIARTNDVLTEDEREEIYNDEKSKWINNELKNRKESADKKGIEFNRDEEKDRVELEWDGVESIRKGSKYLVGLAIVLGMIGVGSFANKLLPAGAEIIDTKTDDRTKTESQETENSEEKKMAEILQNATSEQKQQLVTSYLMEKASEAGLESSSELENSEIIKMHQDNNDQKDIYDGYIVTLEDGQELFVLDENGAEDTLKEMGVNYEIIRADSTEGYRKSIDGNIIKSENGQVVYGKATVELERENDEYTRFKEYPIVDANGVTTFDKENFNGMNKIINEDIDLIEYATGEEMTTEEIGDVLLSNSDFREIYNEVFNNGKEAKANVIELVSIDSEGNVVSAEIGEGNEITAEIDEVKEKLEARNPFVGSLKVDTDGITASNNGQTHSPELDQQNTQHENGDDGRC